MRFRFLLLRVLTLAACGGGEAAVQSDDADVTENAVLSSTFYVKASPIDQSALGVVVADGVAFAPGASSQALPRIMTRDGKPFAELPTKRVQGLTVLVDKDRSHFFGMKPAPIFDASKLGVGTKCTVLGTDMDMYAAGDPTTIALSAAIDRMEDHGLVLAKTTKSTGGDGTLLVCDGKLAGVQAGAGSQGTYHEFRIVDAALADAFAHASGG